MSTWIVGSLVVVVGLLALLGGGLKALIVFLALIGLGTGIYAMARNRPSWVNLPRSRGAQGALLAGSVVALVLGSTLLPGPATTTTAANAGNSVASLAPSPSVTPLVLPDYTNSAASVISTTLNAAGFAVTMQTADAVRRPGTGPAGPSRGSSPRREAPSHRGPE